MASFEINADMITEILSHSHVSVIEKSRLLNKEFNERTHSSSFLKLKLQNTNSVSGYFLEYNRCLKAHSTIIRNQENIPHKSEISLDFLPRGRVNVKACDASHRILLCVNDLPFRGRQPEYMICKPTTKQYMIIPKPKTRYFTIALGLVVTGADPLRYKIIRLSHLPSKENRRYNFNFTLLCEVFDSDSFAWKRLSKNVELPAEDIPGVRMSEPVAAYGFLHWLTANNNVLRFCLKTETWSFLTVPENLASDRSLKLTRYKGKLGFFRSRSKEGEDYQEIWVLESSLGNSWVKVKKIKSMGLEPIGFLSNDVVTLAGKDKKFLYNYNMNNGKSRKLQIRSPGFSPNMDASLSYFHLCSDFKRVEFGGRSNGYQQDKSLRFEYEIKK
ncbi:unnamed protein product [Microthlaspi erraticum]|uniref:F-box associated beta-propeller type 3 domain-containing protein n=1 Tax=Microthlaspi erraticum TaxID=1685480 RepID=A0A6D2KNB9_9BRAS|nr:unnamed protein product [Microthlaspi erraticum]